MKKNFANVSPEARLMLRVFYIPPGFVNAIEPHLQRRKWDVSLFSPPQAEKILLDKMSAFE